MGKHRCINYRLVQVVVHGAAHRDVYHSASPHHTPSPSLSCSSSGIGLPTHLGLRMGHVNAVAHSALVKLIPQSGGLLLMIAVPRGSRPPLQFDMLTTSHFRKTIGLVLRYSEIAPFFRMLIYKSFTFHKYLKTEGLTGDSPT